MFSRSLSGSPRMPASSAESMTGILLKESSNCRSERAKYRAQQRKGVVGNCHMAVPMH